MKKLLLVFSALTFWLGVYAQKPNVAPSAVVTCTGLQATYPPSALNDLNYGTCGTQLFWMSSTSGSTTDYIEWSWSIPQSFDEITFYQADNVASRQLVGGVLQSWDGAQWVNEHTFSNLPLACDNNITFPRITTTKLRMTQMIIGAPGATQFTNVNFREIEIFAASTAPNDAAVLSVDSPFAFCPGTYPIKVTVGNLGVNVIDSVEVNWSVNGVLKPAVNYVNLLDTIGGMLPFKGQVTLGSQVFAANTPYVLKVWTSNPNGAVDTTNFNDTLTITLGTSLFGTYTINDGAATGGTNFNSFTDAFTTITTYGVCGPVVLNVLNGPYYEKAEIGEVIGSSSVNTITVNGNGAMLIDSAVVSGNSAALLINGTDHFILDSLHIMNLATTNGAGLQFMNGADSNIVRNCKIEVDPTSTSSTVSAIAFSGNATSTTTGGLNGNYNLIENNDISGGYYCVRHYGSGTTSRILGNRFIDNTIHDYYVYGLYNYYSEGTKIHGNEIHRMNRSSVSTGYGIYLYYTTENVEVTDNWIHGMFEQATGSTSTFYGIYQSACDNTVGNEGLVANNVVADNGNGGTHYTLYNSSSDGWRYYHNTIVEDDPAASGTGETRLYYNSSGGDCEFKNNLLYMERGTTGDQFMIYMGSTAVTTVIDNNAYYAPAAGTGPVYFGYYGGNVSDFAAWQAVNSNGYDQASFEGAPFFVNAATGDYTPTAAYFNDIGANVLALVPTDITGATRSITPDPGAYEFTPPPGPDMSVSNIYSGGASCGSTTDILVEVLSQGTDTVTSFTLSYTINGVAATPIPVTGVFATGDIDSVAVTGIPISSSSITTVVVTLTAIAPGTDINPSNNVGTINLRAGLSGTYTIDQGMPMSVTNYTTFSGFASDLNTYGVCGNVVANVVGTATTYADRLWLDEISGTSASKTVTINGNGSTLEFLSTNGGERATVTFNGADWVTIDSLNIVATGASSSEYGFGVSLTNNADHNTIRNCVVTVDATSTSSNFAGITISGSLSSATQQGSSGNHNTIEGNIITGGYYGVSSVGLSTDSVNYNSFINNQIHDFYFYGAYCYYNDHLSFEGNDVARPNRTTISSFYGCYVYYSTSAHIIGNKIHDGFAQNLASTSTNYPMYFYYPVGTGADPCIIANNLIYNIESDGTTYGLYISQGNNVDILHNTLVLNDQNKTSTSSYTTRLLYLASAMPDSRVNNNILYLNRDAGGTAHMIYTGGSISEMNNNSYFAPANAPAYTFGYYNGTNLNTFNDWQNNSGLDANGVFGDPYFVNMATGDYHPQSAVIDGGGIDHTSLIPTDIDGITRATPPDVGAYEFIGAPCTGLSQVSTVNISSTAGTIVWAPNPATVTIEWGPVGFKQASIVGTIVNVPIGDTSSVLSGLSSLSCFDYYLTMNCTSGLPGAPPVMGPYTFCTDCARGPLSGTYTVGGAPGPTNFPTLDSVATTLNGCGINGPVIFNLQGGTHNGISLGAIDGSSAVNTITFNGSASFGDSIISTAQTAAIELNGTSYITFNDLYMENNGGMYVVWMHDGSNHLNFADCEVVGSSSTTSTSAVFGASGSSTSVTTYGENVRNLNISGCNIVGNYYGISINGSSTAAKARKISILDNDFENQYYYGIRVYYGDSVRIEENNFPTGLRNTANSYGMYLYYNDNASILKNKVYEAGYSALMFAYSNYSNATPGSYSIVANNMLQSGGTYGMYFYYPVNTDLYHNTIEGGTTYGVYLSGSATATQDVDVRNNIILNSGTGTALYVGTAPLNTSIDYNIYNSGGDIGNGYATLALWQAAAASWNVHSIEGDPILAGSSDFHILGPLAHDTGDASVNILTDIDGDPRPGPGSSKVDIGADEFTPASCFPASNLTMVSATNTTATLEWDTITGAPGYIIEYGAGGFKPGTGTMVSVTGHTYTITGLPTANNLAYQAYIAVNCGAGDTSSWVGPVNIIHSAPPVLCTDDFEVYNDTLIGGQSRLFVGWAGAVTDGEVSTDYAKSGTQSMHIFGSADIVTAMQSFTTGIHSVKFDYYMPTTFGGYYNILHNYTGATNVWAIEVYIDANGTATVNMGTNATGVIGTYSVIPGQWNTIEHIIDLNNDTAWINVNGTSTNVGWQFSLGSTNMGDRFNALDFYAAANAGQTPNYYIDNFCIEPYVPPTCLAPSGLAASNTNRGCDSVEVSWVSNANNNSIIEYGPAGFTPGTGTIVPFVASPYVITGLQPGTSYNFYVADTCANDTSQVAGPFVFTTKPAPVAKASFTYSSVFAGSTQVITFNGSGSTNANSYSWDFGNGNTGTGATPPAEIYNLPNTTVSVKLTVTNSCGSTHDTTITFATHIGLEEPDFAKTLMIYPNPSDGNFNVSFNKPSGGNLSFEIMDASGRMVYSEDLGSFGGTYTGTLNLQGYSNGVYILRINSDLGVVTRRLNKL